MKEFLHYTFRRHPRAVERNRTCAPIPHGQHLRTFIKKERYDMGDSNPLQSLRAPITVVLSIFIVFAVTNLHEADADPNRTNFKFYVFSIIFWALCISVAAWKSPQAQAASSMTFTLTAFLATKLQSELALTAFEARRMQRESGFTPDIEYGDFGSIGPTLWTLSRIMCGATFATAWTLSHHADRTPDEIDSIFHLDRIIGATLACIFPLIGIIASSSYYSGAHTINAGTVILMFLSGFSLTALAVISPIGPAAFLAITLTWIHITHSSEQNRDVSVEVISFPLIAIAATVGLFTMYSLRNPWSRKSS
ncbi:hypothetical protein [Actinomyces oris]|uniref:hypothetical protein n=1 Tax=Actinomyces oris TaxID=544580 RepID=UPI000AD01F75|nr:hypothetical protein [Actinomyces oris]